MVFRNVIFCQPGFRFVQEFVDEQLKTTLWWFHLPSGLSRGAAGRPSVDTADQSGGQLSLQTSLPPWVGQQ